MKKWKFWKYLLQEQFGIQLHKQPRPGGWRLGMSKLLNHPHQFDEIWCNVWFGLNTKKNICISIYWAHQIKHRNYKSCFHEFWSYFGISFYIVDTTMYNCTWRIIRKKNCRFEKSSDEPFESVNNQYLHVWKSKKSLNFFKPYSFSFIF